MSMFNVVIQLGAILAVMVIYFNKLNPFKPTKDKQEVRKTWRLWLKVLLLPLYLYLPSLNLMIGLIPTSITWFLLPLMLIIYGLPLSIWKSAMKRVL